MLKCVIIPGGGVLSLKDEIARAGEIIRKAKNILIGAGAGLSTAAGCDYSGERFKKYFSDFEEKYGFHDMYSGGFYPYDTPGEFWAFWSRNIYYNRYDRPASDVHKKLLELVRNKDYFVLTTNVDHLFQNNGFDKSRLFYTQGDYGLFQCSVPCHNRTYDNEKSVRKMLESQKNMSVPEEFFPHCPKCGEMMTTNLRIDETFVEDAGWKLASAHYQKFLHRHFSDEIVYLELGVGGNTPGIIKYPFWSFTAENEKSFYICINKGQVFAPKEISDRSILIDGDIKDVLNLL